MNLSLIAEMGWKSALIAGAALMLAAMLRSRSSADRAAVLRLAVVLLLLLPMAILALPALQVETPAILKSAAPKPVATASLSPLNTAQPKAAATIGIAEPFMGDAQPYEKTIEKSATSTQAISSTLHPIPIDQLAKIIWFAGLLIISLRLSAGLLTLRRWTGNARTIASPQWRKALAKIERERSSAKAKPVRLLVSKDISAPISWGWRRAAILIDEDSLIRPEDAKAILAHEMAHIDRGDWITLILARTAVALFWFNPLVWLMEREIVQRTEEAADICALREIDPARYAQALVSCARHLTSTAVPANCIGHHGRNLNRRIRAVLENKGRMLPQGSRWTKIAMIGCAGIAAPVAAVKLAPATPATLARPSLPALGQARLTSSSTIAIMPAHVLSATQITSVQTKPTTSPAKDKDARERDAEQAERDADQLERDAERAAEEADRAADQAEREAERAAGQAEREAERAAELAEQIADKAKLQTDRAAEQVRRATKNIDERMIRNAQQVAQKTRISMAKGADGMLRGAESMERGAAKMENYANHLHDKTFREQEIAKATQQGRRLTHEQLLDSIPELLDGAKEMREGAAEMRQGAAEMRNQKIHY